MSALSEYLEKIPQEQKAAVKELNNIITEAAPTLNASIKWGNLTYHNDKNICAIISHKNHINLQIWNGASLQDPNGMLKGTGKHMRHIKIEDKLNIDSIYIKNLVRQALEKRKKT